MPIKNSDGGKIPSEIRASIDGIASELGPDAKKSLEEMVLQLLERVEDAAMSSPMAANAMFVARPSGYVR